VDRYPSAPDADRVANIYYNGIQTMTDKTRFVKDNGFAGMMIWELAHDTQDESISLLRAIDEVLSTSSTKRGPHLAMSSAD
jgi:GH18 family chitinase